MADNVVLRRSQRCAGIKSERPIAAARLQRAFAPCGSGRHSGCRIKKIFRGIKMSMIVIDWSGNTWNVNSAGNFSVNSGYVNYFDGNALNVFEGNGAMALSLYPVGSPTIQGTAQGVMFRNSSNEISVMRNAYVGEGFIRLVEVVKNDGMSDVTLKLSASENIYFDGNSKITKTSSGDRVYTKDDDWYVISNNSDSAAKKIVHVVSTGSGSPASVSVQANDQISTDYILNLAAGEAKGILHFYALAPDEASAVTLAKNIANADSTYLSGLTDADLSQLVNFSGFDVVSSTSATLTQPFQSKLTLTGTRAINGTGNANHNHVIGNRAANILSGLDGNDTLDGAAGDDSLVGGNGTDLLDGGTGNDTMAGGAGDDKYTVDAVGDVVIESANQGLDTVTSSVNYSLAALLNIENVILVGQAIRATGNANENRLVGNELNNLLTGSGGDDTLDGGAGIDTLNGGAGNDVYIVETTADIIKDSGGADRVEASVPFSLAELGDIENLTLTGIEAINGTGNALANVIIGNSAANVIDGGGNSDTLKGGAGDDIYTVQDAGDMVIEAAGEGTDTVISYIDGNYTLAANAENLMLAGSGTAGTGTAANNRLVGQAGNNLLSGLNGDDTLDGAGGSDTLDGGDGNDLYIVDSTSDFIVDSGGTDFVRSSVSFSLAGFGSIENLALTGGGVLSGTGNGLNNVITANDGDSTIDGSAGFDLVSYAGAGAGVSVALTNGAQSTRGSGTDTLLNIEAIEGSRFNDSLRGDRGNNILDGGSGNDSLHGGLGDDLLRGGRGDDVLTDRAGFDTLSGGSGDDLYKVAGNAGSLLIDDISGMDTLDASDATGAVVINLNIGDASNIDGRLVTLSSFGVVDSALDVVLLHDNSNVNYSFNTQVSNLKAMAPQLMSTLSEIHADSRLGLASFVDKDSYAYRTDLTLTDDPARLAAALGTMTSGYSYYGDANSQLEALMQVAVRTSEFGFRDDSLHVVVLATDTRYHLASDTFQPANDGDALLEAEDYPTIELLKAKLAASDILPIFAVNTDNVASYNTLVHQLGVGVVVNLNSDDSNLVDAVKAGMAQATQAHIENATGSAYGDTLIGNGVDNRLEGKGGNDTYYVQDSQDTVVEKAMGGTDLVVSSGSFTLSDYLENLTLSGTQDINATGNALNNNLIGNAGKNLLDGGGGGDRMLGGWGDDTYVVDSVRDKVIEYDDAGMDTVNVAFKYALPENVENLTLIGRAISGAGNGLDNLLTGNDLANKLSGGAGNDTLDGGTGKDTLTGGEGSDKFLINSAGNGSDRITDFVSGVDKIEINKYGFDDFYYGTFDNFTGILEGSHFVVLNEPHATYSSPYGDVFVYHADTGRLCYDSDGNYPNSHEVELLRLLGSKTLVASDIVAVGV